jgi:hypothetical protein
MGLDGWPGLQHHFSQDNAEGSNIIGCETNGQIDMKIFEAINTIFRILLLVHSKVNGNFKA